MTERSDSARIRTAFLEESKGLSSKSPFRMSDHDLPVDYNRQDMSRTAELADDNEVMERYGYKICPQCNADQIADRFVGPFCEYCGGDEVQ